MLRLVPPPDGGNGGVPPTHRKGTRSPSLVFTHEETAHIRAALKNTARAYGGYDVLASVMGMPIQTLYKAAQRRPTGVFTIRLAQAAGVSVESILSGALNAAGRCPSCGARVGDGRLSTKGGAP